jgi:hypothetical protein
VERILCLLIAALVVLAATVIAAQVVGKRTMMAVSGASAIEIRRVCRACFPSSRWVPDSGPGLINMRLTGRGARSRSVVSVAIEEGAAGGYLVSVWRSRGEAWMELDDALMVRRIQDRILVAINALPSAIASRPSLY